MSRDTQKGCVRPSPLTPSPAARSVRLRALRGSQEGLPLSRARRRSHANRAPTNDNTKNFPCRENDRRSPRRLRTFGGGHSFECPSQSIGRPPLQGAEPDQHAGALLLGARGAGLRAHAAHRPRGERVRARRPGGVCGNLFGARGYARPALVVTRRGVLSCSVFGVGCAETGASRPVGGVCRCSAGCAWGVHGRGRGMHTSSKVCE